MTHRKSLINIFSILILIVSTIVLIASIYFISLDLNNLPSESNTKFVYVDKNYDYNKKFDEIPYHSIVIFEKIDFTALYYDDIIYYDFGEHKFGYFYKVDINGYIFKTPDNKEHLVHFDQISWKFIGIKEDAGFLYIFQHHLAKHIILLCILLDFISIYFLIRNRKNYGSRPTK